MLILLSSASNNIRYTDNTSTIVSISPLFYETDYQSNRPAIAEEICVSQDLDPDIRMCLYTILLLILLSV